jgi:hypothetical protein
MTLIYGGDSVRIRQSGKKWTDMPPQSTGAEDDFPEEEDEPIEYGSDILVEVITAQIISGGSIAMEGFKVDDDGSIVRTGVAEETDVVHDEPTTGGRDSIVAVSLGRGHRVKVVSTRELRCRM